MDFSLQHCSYLYYYYSAMTAHSIIIDTVYEFSLERTSYTVNTLGPNLASSFRPSLLLLPLLALILHLVQEFTPAV
jgi:hypothetical protein